MVKAVEDSWGLALAEHEGQRGIKIGTDCKGMSDANGIADLGNGLASAGSCPRLDLYLAMFLQVAKLLRSLQRTASPIADLEDRRVVAVGVSVTG